MAMTASDAGPSSASTRSTTTPSSSPAPQVPSSPYASVAVAASGGGMMLTASEPFQHHRDTEAGFHDANESSDPTGSTTVQTGQMATNNRSSSPPPNVYKLLPPVIVSPNGVVLAPLRDRLSSKNPHVLDTQCKSERSAEAPVSRRTRATRRSGRTSAPVCGPDDGEQNDDYASRRHNRCSITSSSSSSNNCSSDDEIQPKSSQGRRKRRRPTKAKPTKTRQASRRKTPRIGPPAAAETVAVEEECIAEVEEEKAENGNDGVREGEKEKRRAELDGDGEFSSSTSVHDACGDKTHDEHLDDDCSSGPSSPASPCPSKRDQVCKKNCLRNCTKADLDGFRDVLAMLDKETLRKIQMDLILTGVRARPVQRRSIKARTSETVARRGSLVYSLVIDHKTVDMCKKCFMDMTGISAGVLRKCLSHLLEHQVTGDISELHKIGQSNRGKHAPAHKLKIDVVEQITRHIETFPRDKSFYPTPDGAKEREFITNDTSISQMCTLYNESVMDESHKVSYATYRRVLVEKFNIGFKSTSSMHLCALCQKLDARLKDMDNPDRETVQLTKDLHQAEAKNRQNNKEADKQFAMHDHTIKVLAVDLQKTLPAPMLRSNEAIYRRHLCVYSYTVCDVASGQMACYLWDESIAGRGKMEIASCLKNFIDYTMAQSPDTRTVIVWSDNWLCPNKNLSLCAMLIQLSVRYNIKIVQKYLVAGHTQNECDAFHSRVDVQRKKEAEILVPADWCGVLHRADSKVAVVQMMPYSFFDFSVLIEGPDAPLEKKPAGLEGVSWTKAVSLTYTGCRVDILTQKYETVTVNFERSKERLLTTYPPVLTRRISVSPAKKADCVYLMRDRLDMCKQFYEGLETADVCDVVDPASEERVFGEKVDEAMA